MAHQFPTKTAAGASGGARRAREEGACRSVGGRSGTGALRGGGEGGGGGGGRRSQREERRGE
eukprot:8100316-Pyramimonas_sp.AAC.1